MFLNDTLTNLVSGLGTAKDKAHAGRFVPTLLSYNELTFAYEGDWIAGKIIDAPCDDMTREWRTWDAGQRQSKALIAEERRLDVRGIVNRAMKLGRLYGGAVVLIGTGDADPSLPLNVNAIRRGGVQYLHALSRWEVNAFALDRDPLSPYFGGPLYYELATPERGSVIVHPSRMIRFFGQGRLEMARAMDPWGLSTLQRCYEAVRNAAAAPGALAALAQEAKVDIISLPNLMQNVLDAGYREQVQARFALANAAKSLVNALVLDKDETWDHKQVSLAHWADVLRVFLEVAAGAADMPVTRLLGVAPKGLNATGESDLRNYYDMLSSYQEVHLGPTLAPLDECLIRSALGARPQGVTYSWNPLWQLRESEMAALRLQEAQTDDIYASMSVMPPSAMRRGIQNRLMGGATYPGLAEALAAAQAANEQNAPLVAKADRVETNAPKTLPAKS